MSESQTTHTSYYTYAWKQFRSHKPALVSLYVLAVLVVIAILAPVIANEKPLYVRYHGETFYPALSWKKQFVIEGENGKKEIIQPDIAEWKRMSFEKVIWAPIPYSPEKTDRLNSGYKSPQDEQLFMRADGNIVPMPSRFRHIMGTNSLGEDVLSGLIHGTRVSLSIGCISMSIAALLGILLGAAAGYFGDTRLRTTRGRFWSTIFGIAVGWFYGFQVRAFVLRDALSGREGNFLLAIGLSLIILVSCILAFSFLGKWLGKLPVLRTQVHIPVDNIVSRTIEILHAMPTFVLILTVAAIARPSLTNVMIIIGLTSWTGIARLVRAELLRIRGLEYIQAARSLGFGEWEIIFRHALPNAIAPALVSIAFGIASAILTESSLSFLGIGVPSDTVTWGSLVNDGRQQFNAWWLVVFPGVAIFMTVTMYNLIGEAMRDAFDPRQKK